MLSVSSSSSSPMLGWALDEAMYSYNINHSFYDHSRQDLPAAGAGFSLENVGNFSQNGDQNQTEGRNGDSKKVNHNASERHRRKKINELYSSLRSLLPASEQSRRMSIPTTVAKVLKYIPELQGEVERMEKRKQNMSRKIHQIQEKMINSASIKKARSEHYRQEINDRSKGNINQKKIINISNVLTCKIGDKEIVIQVSSLRISIHEILMSLEEEGFQLISSFSSSDTFSGRNFLNLHLQRPFGLEKLECEGLDEKLLSMLGNR